MKKCFLSKMCVQIYSLDGSDSVYIIYIAGFAEGIVFINKIYTFLFRCDPCLVEFISYKFIVVVGLLIKLFTNTLKIDLYFQT